MKTEFLGFKLKNPIIIAAVRCILGVNIETAEPTLSTYGGYSKPA